MCVYISICLVNVLRFCCLKFLFLLLLVVTLMLLLVLLLFVFVVHVADDVDAVGDGVIVDVDD